MPHGGMARLRAPRSTHDARARTSVTSAPSSPASPKMVNETVSGTIDTRPVAAALPTRAI